MDSLSLNPPYPIGKEIYLCRKFIITLDILLATAFAGGTVGISYRTVFANEHEHGTEHTHHGAHADGKYRVKGVS